MTGTQEARADSSADPDVEFHPWLPHWRQREVNGPDLAGENNYTTDTFQQITGHRVEFL